MEYPDIEYPILDIRNEAGLVKDRDSDLVKACGLFVYLNVQFRGFQFEEEELKVPTTFVANIHHNFCLCISLFPPACSFLSFGMNLL